MKILERSFLAKDFRPRPACYISENQRSAAVLTSWGQGALSTDTVFEEMEEQFNLFSEDSDSTRPHQYIMAGLSTLENDIRTAVLHANKSIYAKINQEEFCTGFELFFAGFKEGVCAFVQAGQPSVLLDRSKGPLQSVGLTADWSVLGDQLNLPPLPFRLLGLYEDLALQPYYFRLQKGDRLILLNRTYVPPAWLSVKREERNLENLSRLAVKDNPDTPFWIGLLDF